MGVFYRILEIKSLYKSNRMSVCSEGFLQFEFKPIETLKPVCRKPLK